MTTYSNNHPCEKLNKVIQLSLEPCHDPLTKALQIARESGAFKHSNVIFMCNKLYPINPQNPQQSIQHLKMMKQQRGA
jgi:hypothetical protein